MPRDGRGARDARGGRPVGSARSGRPAPGRGDKGRSPQGRPVQGRQTQGRQASGYAANRNVPLVGGAVAPRPAIVGTEGSRGPRPVRSSRPALDPNARRTAARPARVRAPQRKAKERRGFPNPFAAVAGAAAGLKRGFGKAPKQATSPVVGTTVGSGLGPAPTPHPGTGARPDFLNRPARKGAVPKTAVVPSPVVQIGTPLEGPAPAPGRERREQYQKQKKARVAAIVLGVLLAVLLVALVAFAVMRNSSSFSVDNVDFEATEHVSEADISNLLSLDEGATLLNVDAGRISEQLKRDPWVASVNIEREFPHTLRITVQEQSVDALVVMNSGSMGWYLGSSGTWIEPVKIEAAEGQSVDDAALPLARAVGAVLVTDVPATVDPQAGSAATDDVLAAVLSFREGFSDDFSAKIVSYSAPSVDAVSCVLESGVEVSLGSAANIAYKEEVAAALLAKYPDQITYINVRVPAQATVRKIGSSDVTAGTGAAGDQGSAAGSDTSDSDEPSTDASTADAAE